MSARERRVFVYGSCVSRDTFGYLAPLGYSLTHYAARQSLISAYARADPQRLPPFTTSSSFQRRMIEEDWRSGLVQRLRTRRDDTDVLLWDLCDERLGVRRLRLGGFVTRSVDLLSTGLDEEIASASEHIDFGTSQHFRLWRRRLTNWRKTLDDLKLTDSLVLLAPPWAELSANGEPAPTSFGRSAAEANALFRPYREAVVEMFACPMVTLPLDEARCDTTHQWGVAPFHYTADNYAALASGIDEAVNRRA